MSNQGYMPVAEKEKVEWHSTFITGFSQIAASLGFTTAEITAANNDYLACKYMLDTVGLFDVELSKRVAYKALLFDGDIGTTLGAFPTIPTLPATPATVVAAGVYKRLGKTVQRIKNHPNYNETIGRSLGIIAPKKIIDLNKLKPQPVVKAITAEHIKIGFPKADMDGVYVFGAVAIPASTTEQSDAAKDLDNLVTWAELGKCNTSPFIDTRVNSSLQPETRQYKMIYFKKDKPVGLESDVLRVIAQIYGKAGAELANKVK